MEKKTATPPPVIPEAASGSSSVPAAASGSHADSIQPYGQPVLDDGLWNDEDDLPPQYSEIDAVDRFPYRRYVSGIHVYNRTWDSHPYSIQQRRTDSHHNDSVVSQRLDQDPELLEAFVQDVGALAPRQKLCVRGTHTETRMSGGKKETRTVTDFEITLDLTPYLFADPRTGESWARLRTVENDERAQRGTIFPWRAPVPPHVKKHQKHRRQGQPCDLEQQPGGCPADVPLPKPTLKEWCHRYCASGFSLKSFILRRRVVGFDEDRMQSLLRDLVRKTGYRGSVSISFPVENDAVYVMNDCRINRWRETGWIRWAFYLSFMWIFSWPALLLSTKRWEVVVVEWPFARQDGPQGPKEYVSMSEDSIFSVWQRAIYRAVKSRQQTTLDRFDLVASEVREDFFSRGSPGYFV
ncbi:hypothetical protein VTJ83DRAFT_3270 [Remersonia thermophila]|uniref:Uncharacterized protein n=1 Tax=Remersonia thermophila TaxID=72144 RepID=A0ABR4DFU0_9PEZI